MYKPKDIFFMHEFLISKAETEDAEPILQAHFAAVHQTAAAFYSEEIVQNWSCPITDEKIERIRRAISSQDEFFIVARQGAEVVEFGSIVPRNDELRSLYIHPKVGRRRIGSQILQILEKTAISEGRSLLKVDASVNAELFYAKHGFEIVERGTHCLHSGHEMACIKMREEGIQQK